MRQARMHRGLAQWEVAERIGVSEAFYARIERNKRSLTLKRFVLLVIVLGVSADSLLSDDNPIVYRDDWLLQWPHDDDPIELRRLYRQLRQAPDQVFPLIGHILDVVDEFRLAKGPSASR